MSTFSPLSGSSAGGEAPTLRRLRVLLVEDDADDALLLRRHLSKAGFAPEVHRVETADGMLEVLGEEWDCILADYNLPLFSAPEALRLLQATEHDIPFIMMSGAVSEDTAVAAMRAGAHDYVSKENLARLVPAIERELAEAASRRVKRATESALRSSEERFHRLVEATPLALLISDMKGCVTYSNRGAERLLGLTQAEIEASGVPLDRVFSLAQFGEDNRQGDNGPQIASALLRKVDGPHEDTWETVCRVADGSEIPVLLGAAVLNPEASFESLQIAIFFVDLGEQKRSEEVLRRTEKLAAAGRLAASIAHEINNPLEAITNCLYLIEQCTLPGDARSYLQMATRELDRVTHITTQTLRFYRQSTRPILTDIPDLLDSVLTLYEARIRDHSIVVTRDFEGASPVRALDGEIRQVLANMIGNAVDAMTNQAGPRLLVLRARTRRCWRTHVMGVSILIADRGTGMSQATLRRIFEPFFSTKGITGTGLGLWVSQEIISKHNGRVQVRTRETEPSGTVFRLFLPLDGALATTPYEAGIPTL